MYFLRIFRRGDAWDGASLSEVRAVIITTSAYLAVATIFAFVSQNWEFLFYIGVVVIVGLLILFLHEKVSLTKGVLWGLSSWGLLHMMGGLMAVPDAVPVDGKQVLYSMWIIPNVLKYDQLVHAFGFGMATWACWQSLRTRAKLIEPTFGMLALCVLASLGLGAVNETIEFAATRILADTNVGGYENTGWDLVANLVGSIIAAVIISYRRWS